MIKGKYFNRRGFIEHEQFKDVMCEIVKVQWTGPEYTKLKIKWWNTGRNHSGVAWDLRLTQKIKINKEDYTKWKYIWEII